MKSFTEFKLCVMVNALEEPEYQPCPELGAICRLLGAPSPTRSPSELFPADSPLRFVSEIEPSDYLEVDIRTGPGNSMAIVEIRLRCRTAVADDVELQLRRIRDNSEMRFPLLRGDLGIVN